mgnify:FL=1
MITSAVASFIKSKIQESGMLGAITFLLANTNN